MKVYKAVKTINDVLDRILSCVTIATMALMSLLIFAQVIFRYILHFPLSWSEELSTYLFTIGTFLGAVVVLRANKHIRVTAFLKLIKNTNITRVITFGADLLMMVLCLLVCINSGTIISQLLKVGQVAASMPWLKTSYIYACVPVSMGLMVLMELEFILKSIFDFSQDDLLKTGGEET